MHSILLSVVSWMSFCLVSVSLFFAALGLLLYPKVSVPLASRVRACATLSCCTPKFLCSLHRACAHAQREHSHPLTRTLPSFCSLARVLLRDTALVLSAVSAWCVRVLGCCSSGAEHVSTREHRAASWSVHGASVPGLPTHAQQQVDRCNRSAGVLFRDFACGAAFSEGRCWVAWAKRQVRAGTPFVSTTGHGGWVGLTSNRFTVCRRRPRVW